MAWSETMFTVQQFYNAFELNNRVGVLEHKTPLIARANASGQPEDDAGVAILGVEEGTVWLRKAAINGVDCIVGAGVADMNGQFNDMIDFSASVENSTVSQDLIDALVNTYGIPISGDTMGDVLTGIGAAISNKADTNHNHSANDINGGVLPVQYGGTGMNAVNSGNVLVGAPNGAMTQRPIDTQPTSGSVNPLSSGGAYSALAGKAPTNHASTSGTYGLGRANTYGHVRTVDDYTLNQEDDGVVPSQKAMFEFYKFFTRVVDTVPMVSVKFDEPGYDVYMTYLDGKIETVVISDDRIVDTLYSAEPSDTTLLKVNTILFDADGNITFVES